MRKLFALILVVALLIPARVSLADTVLFITPTRVNLSDKDSVEEIRVTNMSSIARSYNLSLQNLIMTANGTTTQVDNFDYAAKRMIRFVPRQFDLAPNKTQVVRIMGRIRPDTADGEYHSHLEFLEDISKRKELNEGSGETESKMMAHVSYATGIPVTIRKGAIDVSLGARDVKLSQNKNGQYVVSLMLERSGNGQGEAFIDTDYTGPDGKTIKAATRRTVYIYRERDERPFEYVLNVPDGQTLQKGGELKITVFNNYKAGKEPATQLTLPFN